MTLWAWVWFIQEAKANGGILSDVCLTAVPWKEFNRVWADLSGPIVLRCLKWCPWVCGLSAGARAPGTKRVCHHKSWTWSQICGWACLHTAIISTNSKWANLNGVMMGSPWPTSFHLGELSIRIWFFIILSSVSYLQDQQTKEARFNSISICSNLM